MVGGGGNRETKTQNNTGPGFQVGARGRTVRLKLSFSGFCNLTNKNPGKKTIKRAKKTVCGAVWGWVGVWFKVAAGPTAGAQNVAQPKRK